MIGLIIGSKEPALAQLFYVISIFILCVTGFAIPIGLGLREAKFESDTPSYLDTSDSASSKVPMTSIENLGFLDHPKIAKLVAQSEAYRFLEEFLADTQDINLSHWFLLWGHIAKWNQLEVTRYIYIIFFND